VLRTRLQAAIDTADYAPFEPLFELLPSFTFTPGVTALLGLGLALGMESQDDVDNSMGFYLFPHVRVGSRPSFFAGFELRAASVDCVDDMMMSWRVPVGLMASF